MSEDQIRYKSLDFLGYPMYRVGDDGSVWRYYKTVGWRKRKPYYNGTNPRLAVHLSRDSKAKTYTIHRLVLLAFVGPCPDGMQGCHNNGNPDNNNLWNLRWDTPTANQADRKLHGTTYEGEQHHSAKLTENDVRAIRKLYATGSYSYTQLAKKYRVDFTNIACIVKNKTWKHIL